MPPPWRFDLMPLRVAEDHAIHLWQASLECPGWKDLLPFLSDDEVQRASRFAFGRDARRYVVSHVVLRTVLGRLVGLPPEQVALRTEAGGKPVLGDGGAGLHFSLSRSGELVLGSVASRPLGVDLEWLEAPMDVEALAGAALSPREHEAFGRTLPERQREVLLHCWTQKEAILKATGQGLSIPPSVIQVLLTPGDTVQRRSAIACLGSRWQVDTVLPRPGYIGAVALLPASGQVTT